jgi:hypothetical protein
MAIFAGAATPVVIMAVGTTPLAGKASPYAVVSGRPIKPGKPMPIVVVAGTVPLLAGNQIPVTAVAGPPKPGKPTPVR